MTPSALSARPSIPLFAEYRHGGLRDHRRRCCAALASNADSVNGELAGGRVVSLVTRRDKGIVVAVASNVAHANTSALALKVAEGFAEQK